MGGISAALKSANRDMARDLIPVKGYENGLFLTSDNEIGFGFVAEPLWAADSHTASRLNALMNLDWPENSALQFSLWQGPDITGYLDEYESVRDPKTRQEAQVRTEFLRNGAWEPLIDRLIVRNAQLIITFKTPLPKGHRKIPQSFLDMVENIKGACDETLETVGVQHVGLSAEILLRIYQTMFVRNKDAEWRTDSNTYYNDNEPFEDQIFDYDTEINISRSEIATGHDVIKTLSIKRFPKFSYFGDAVAFIGDPQSGVRGIFENVLISASIIFPSVEMTKAKMSSKRSYIQHQAYGPLLKHIPELAELNESFSTLHESFNDGDRPIVMYLGISVFVHQSKTANVAACVSNIKTYWRELGFQLAEDKFITLPAFLNQIPFGVNVKGYNDMFRYKTMATRHCIPMLPLFSDWKGSVTPALSFISRKGQAMKYSLFDSDSNYNLVIAAQSGSGKSFLTNEIIKSYNRMGGLVWVIDVGRSYEKLCHGLDGQFMVFTKESNLCLNPFSMIKDYEEEADIVIGIIQAMAAPTEKLTDFQVSVLRRVTSEVWSESGSGTTIDDVAKKLKSEEDIRVRDIGNQLFAFTKDGEYGRFFYGENNMSFTNPFTVLELEELKGKSNLQQVILLQLIYQIQQEMYMGEKDRPKLVLVDEAWDLLTHGDVAKFIETGYRRFRKYGGSAVTVTQSINDLYDSPSGHAISESSAHKMLLGQQSEAIDQIKESKRLSLSDGAYELLKTVRTVPGKYSEIFFIGPYGAGIGKLIVDNFHKLLYSTNPKDVGEIDRYRKQGLTIEDAIIQILKSRGLDSARSNDARFNRRATDPKPHVV